LEPVTETEKVSSTFTEKTKSLKLPERLRNLSITPSDVERVVELPEKLKSRDDDHAEHSRGGGIWRGVSMQRHCEYCMHKDNRDYKNAEQRREKGCRCGGEFRCVQGGRAQEKKMHSRGMLH
jgi:hypothetical protein